MLELKTLIAGIGDLLRSDDGFGPEVIKQLEKLRLPDNVIVRDYGISCLDLIFDLKDFDKVIFVDVIDFNGKPGEVRVVKPRVRRISEEEIAKSINISLHGIELRKIIDLAYSLNVLPRRVLVVGCKPKNLSFGLSLSKEVKEAVEKTVKIILREIVKG